MYQFLIADTFLQDGRNFNEENMQKRSYEKSPGDTVLKVKRNKTEIQTHTDGSQNDIGDSPQYSHTKVPNQQMITMIPLSAATR